MIEITEDLLNRLNNLKRNTFFEILDLVGRVFIVVDYDESVVIGNRGFLPEEKERGLVLVFNKRMNFLWQSEALEATLIFGERPEKCYIPTNFITGVFSPDLRVQLVVPSIRIPKDENLVNQAQKAEQTEAVDEKKRRRPKKSRCKVIDINKFRQKNE